MILVMIILEVITFLLAGCLIYVAAIYLDQYNAERDNMVKSSAGFLFIFLLIKGVNQLIVILHYEGTLLTG